MSCVFFLILLRLVLVPLPLLCPFPPPYRPAGLPVCRSVAPPLTNFINSVRIPSILHLLAVFPAGALPCPRIIVVLQLVPLQHRLENPGEQGRGESFHADSLEGGAAQAGEK